MDDVHGDYPPGIGDDVGAPTWGDLATAPVDHHYLSHRSVTGEGHHHHGDDGSVLYHDHDGWLYTDDSSGEPVHPDHDHEFNILSVHNGIFYGPADHDHGSD